MEMYDGARRDSCEHLLTTGADKVAPTTELCSQAGLPQRIGCSAVWSKGRMELSRPRFALSSWRGPPPSLPAADITPFKEYDCKRESRQRGRAISMALVKEQ